MQVYGSVFRDFPEKIVPEVWGPVSKKMTPEGSRQPTNLIRDGPSRGIQGCSTVIDKIFQ